jgi:hypothetical protein
MSQYPRKASWSTDMSCHVAVILFAGPPRVEDSCGTGASLAANFLQRQQKQRELLE